ncbi:MAG: hypothetical protein ACI8RD_007276 [Bacillariaceae sp.]|jgi:hypothetical protein
MCAHTHMLKPTITLPHRRGANTGSILLPQQIVDAHRLPYYTNEKRITEQKEPGTHSLLR